MKSSTPLTEGSDDVSGELGSLLRQVAEIPEVRRGPPEPDRTGQQLAHFRIRARLGQGGMGLVYAADDLKLRRKVALKVLPLSMVADEERRRRFLVEARSVSAVLHPNLATVFEVGESDGTVFLAMEYVDGITLRAYLGQHGGRLDPAEVLRIVREIARGLGKAHEAGVVHRDLKPENVMIAANGTVKVLDFGLAKLTQNAALEVEGDDLSIGEDDLASRAGRVLGTPGYMSPEQAAGAEVDARTDVFSVGVILYEMVTGVRPFSMKHDRPRPIREVARGVPSPLVRVVERCLEKRKEDRFTDGTALLAELDRAHGELGKGSRARIGTGVAALLFALAAGTGAWFALPHDRSAPAISAQHAQSPSPLATLAVSFKSGVTEPIGQFDKRCSVEANSGELILEVLERGTAEPGQAYAGCCVKFSNLKLEGREHFAADVTVEHEENDLQLKLENVQHGYKKIEVYGRVFSGPSRRVESPIAGDEDVKRQVDKFCVVAAGHHGGRNTIRVGGLEFAYSQ